MMARGIRTKENDGNVKLERELGIAGKTKKKLPEQSRPQSITAIEI